MSDPAPAEVLEIGDERSRLCEEALGLISTSFVPQDRHPTSELRSEVEEKRLGLLTAYDFHLLAYPDEHGRVRAAGAGVYLAGINAGFVAYLAVHQEHQRKRLGRRVRERLVECFRADARHQGHDELKWVMGEIRVDSPWLTSVVRRGGAIPFDLDYYHPGMRPGERRVPYVLYREPVGDRRLAIPSEELRRVLYSVWRRAYRVRYPLEKEAFRAMLTDLEGRTEVGIHPQFAHLASVA